VLATPSERILHFEQFTEARSNFSRLFNEAVDRELPVVIGRGMSERGLLVARAFMLRLLSTAFQFHVDVLPEDDGGFTLWIRELDIGGTGPTLRDARSDLLSAVNRYMRDYWQQFELYRHLPDMAAKEPYVLRLSLADTEEELLKMLFGATASSSPSREPEPVAV
jgi:hypothetical protein